MSSRNLIITIDTESDWLDKSANTLENMKSLEMIAELFIKYGMRPTYLITYEVAIHKEYAAELRRMQDAGLCEVGTHLHVWSTPPFTKDNGNGVDTHLIDGLQSELTNEEFYGKMTALHNAVGDAMAHRPTSHRAGRWAIDNRTMHWLADNGYLCDTSVCPKTDWTFEKGVRENIKTNTFNAPEHAYFPHKDDLTIEGGKDALDIVELPVTHIPANYIFGGSSSKVSKKINNLFRNLGARVHQDILLRPSYYMPPKTFYKISEHLYNDGRENYVMMFHSSECHVGTSPQSKSEKRYSMLMHRLELSLKAAKNSGLKGCTLSEAASDVLKRK